VPTSATTFGLNACTNAVKTPERGKTGCRLSALCAVARRVQHIELDLLHGIFGWLTVFSSSVSPNDAARSFAI
jgi:hypothetical protein